MKGFYCSLEGADLLEILMTVCHQYPFKNSCKPDQIFVDQKKVKDIPENWLEDFLRQGIEDFSASWGDFIPNTDLVNPLNSHGVILDSNSCVKILISDKPPETIREVLNLLGSVPWTVASFGTTHDDWNSGEKQDQGTGYIGPSLGNLHYRFGWACAFKGEGHNRLVSKRVLDYGPWRVIRDEVNDITLVQFYDLNVDADTALEQAKPGHELMGKAGCGSLIHAQFKFYGELKGLYQPEKRKLEIVVAGRDLPLTEIIDACKAKYAQSLGPDQPIDNVAFIFTASEEEARKYLFDIWLRGLECWAFIDHRPVRIDEDYTPPPPEKPEWVQKLEAQQTT